MRSGYAEKIRQLVPAYDEMVETIISMLALFSPESILDIGAGSGTVSREVLNRLVGSRLIAVEACEEMVGEASRVLAAVDRCSVIHGDILEFEPSVALDGIYSNLVLHNIPSEGKRRLLASLCTWLEPGGVFIWGDLIRYTEPDVQAHFVAQRVAYAQASGCDDQFVQLSFLKEKEEDYPWTVLEMLAETKRAGFPEPQCVWCHDTFAIILATKQR